MYEAIGSELFFVARLVLVVGGFVRQGKVNERGLDDVFSASARNRASAAPCRACALTSPRTTTAGSNYAVHILRPPLPNTTPLSLLCPSLTIILLLNHNLT
jgi:hypothetical protein